MLLPLSCARVANLDMSILREKRTDVVFVHFLYVEVSGQNFQLKYWIAAEACCHLPPPTPSAVRGEVDEQTE